jgi:hypothetical protein
MKMSKRFYAVQHGDDFASDYGSSVKREAMKMARELAKEYPGEEIRICLCREDDDFCEGEIIVKAGSR